MNSKTKGEAIVKRVVENGVAQNDSIQDHAIRDHAIQRKQQILTLSAMCLALSMAALDDTVVNVALPSLQAQLGMSVAGLQWMVNAYLLPIACLVLPAGTLGDTYGRRRLFLMGLVGFVVASVLVGLSASGQIAIVGRLLQGICAAALLPTSLAILVDAFPNLQQRTKAIGIWSGVSGLALIVGPALGGLLIDTLGWRSIFFLNVPLGMMTFGLTCRAVPAGWHGDRYRRRVYLTGRSALQMDWLGALLSVTMLAALITLLMGGDGMTLWRGLGLGLLSLGSAIAFVVVERYSARPMLPLTLFQQPTFTTAIIINILLFFMFGESPCFYLVYFYSRCRAIQPWLQGCDFFL
ncbi:MAG: MFS transporter [Phormidesmis sp. RL_2_1]|nr:MFS transporter [Phormidesmis sp. RL_2_1]